MTGLSQLAALAAPHLAAVALHALRLLPVAVLSLFLGGPLVPAPIRLGARRRDGRGRVPRLAGARPVEAGLVDLAAMASRELALGMALGWLAALPDIRELRVVSVEREGGGHDA